MADDRLQVRLSRHPPLRFIDHRRVNASRFCFFSVDRYFKFLKQNRKSPLKMVHDLALALPEAGQSISPVSPVNCR